MNDKLKRAMIRYLYLLTELDMADKADMNDAEMALYEQRGEVEALWKEMD